MPESVLLRGGAVYSPDAPSATAMLVVGDRVTWVGDEAGARIHLGSVGSVVELDGALVTPAFVDSHVHLTETGLASDGLDLTACASLAECLDLVASRARSRPGVPVLGHGWDERLWPEARPPKLAELDRAAAGAAVYLARIDVHSAVVSSALLDAEPAIARADGYADGLVRRDAHHLARRATRDRVTPGRRRELQRRTLHRAAALGIGAVHEMGAPHIAGPDDLRSALGLPVEEAVPDVVGYWGETDDGLGTAAELGCAGAAGDLNLDGSLGSRTAALSDPYRDASGERGFLYLDLGRAAEHVVACTRAGMQAGFHCIGDEAVRTAVTAIGMAAERCGLAEVVAARHRLEHVEMITSDLVAEMARLGVTASVQPRFDEFWGGAEGMYAARLGRARARTLNPFAAQAGAGVTLAFGSDSPVTPLGGWQAVRAAVYHRTPMHRLSVRAAFSAATRGGWRAAGIDDAGVLSAGMLASYAVWEIPGVVPSERAVASRTGPPSGKHWLPDLSPGADLPTCRRTVARGRTVYDRLGQ